MKIADTIKAVLSNGYSGDAVKMAFAACESFVTSYNSTKITFRFSDKSEMSIDLNDL